MCLYRYVPVPLCACTVTSLYRYVHVPLRAHTFICPYRYVPVPLYACTVMCLYRYVHVPLYACTVMWIYRYVSVSLCACIFMCMYRYMPVPLCEYTAMCLYRYVHVSLCACTVMCVLYMWHILVPTIILFISTSLYRECCLFFSSMCKALQERRCNAAGCVMWVTHKKGPNKTWETTRNMSTWMTVWRNTRQVLWGWGGEGVIDPLEHATMFGYM